ncbi:hypothetical protein [Bradyrhizobium sp. USDA 10063]
MALSYSHPDRQWKRSGSNRSPVARALRQSKALFRMIHRWITAAKIRRLQNELLFRASYRDHWAEQYTPDHADKSPGVPQRPHILSEKWDY